MEITEVQINANYLRWQKALEKYGIYSQDMINGIGEKIRVAAFDIGLSTGCTYKGSLLDVTFRICSEAHLINETYNRPENKERYSLYMKEDSLMRPILLMNIGKAINFIEETDEWKSRHVSPVKFGEKNTKTTMTVDSLFLCQYYGVRLMNMQEYEAMHIMDDNSIIKGISKVSTLALRIWQSTLNVKNMMGKLYGEN